MSQKVVKKIKKFINGNKKWYRQLKKEYGEMNVFEKTEFNKNLKEELK